MLYLYKENLLKWISQTSFKQNYIDLSNYWASTIFKEVYMKNTDFEQIYKKYHKNLLVYALSLCGDYDLAQSLVQVTFAKAYLSYREGGSLKFWLSKVLKNEFINHIRHSSRYVDDPDLIFERLSGPDNPLDILIKEESMREVAHGITLLPKNYRVVLMYSIYMQLKDEEIADIMNTSPANIRKIRSRARQRLKKILIERKWGDKYEEDW